MPYFRSTRSGFIAKKILISLLLNTFLLNAQILQDKNTLNLIQEDVNYIYNFNFEEARRLTTEVANLYPGHPIEYLLSGMLTYWENYPLLSSNSAHELFENDMRQCIKLSENYRNSDNESELLLANLCARGMLLMFYADNDLITEVIPLTISSYKHLRRAFDFTSSCSDLYYFTGLYNYYREAYPREYHVYKSLAMLFPKGGLEIGLKDLQIAASTAVVLGPESYYLLTWIYMNFEYNYTSSLIYCRMLSEKYPFNVIYKASYLKNLMLLKEYDEVEKLMPASPEEENNQYYRAQLYIFKGILEEKKYVNNELAIQYYNKGIDQLSFTGEYGNEFASYAYFGLSRISDSKGEKKPAKMYRTQAEKLSEFKKINFDK